MLIYDKTKTDKQTYPREPRQPNCTYSQLAQSYTNNQEQIKRSEKSKGGTNIENHNHIYAHFITSYVPRAGVVF